MIRLTLNLHSRTTPTKIHYQRYGLQLFSIKTHKIEHKFSQRTFKNLKTIYINKTFKKQKNSQSQNPNIKLELSLHSKNRQTLKLHPYFPKSPLLFL